MPIAILVALIVIAIMAVCIFCAVVYGNIDRHEEWVKSNSHLDQSTGHLLALRGKCGMGPYSRHDLSELQDRVLSLEAARYVTNKTFEDLDRRIRIANGRLESVGFGLTPEHKHVTEARVREIADEIMRGSKFIVAQVAKDKK